MLKKKIYNRQTTLLLLILILAAFLRFYNIQNSGLKFYDEGVYLIEGSWLNGDVFYNYSYLAPLKPLHSALVAVGLRIFGYNDYSGLVISAFFGTLTVLVVYLIGKHLHDWKTGILASFILSIMGLHIVYSRTILSEVNMTFFFSLAFLFYILAKKTNKNLFFVLSGILFGAAFEIRYLAAFLFLIPLIIEFLEIKQKTKILKNLSLILFPFLVVFFIGWLFYALHGVNYPNLIFQYFEIGSEYQSGSNFIETLITYTYFVIKTISPLVLIFFLFGLYFAVKRKDSFLLVWFIVWLSFLFFFGHDRDRDLIPLLPPLALIAAQGFSIFDSKKVASFLSKIYIEPKLAVIISIFLILISSLYISLNFIMFTSPYYSEVGKFLIADNVTGTLSTNPSLVGFYTHKPAEYLAPITKDRLTNFSSKGFTHVLVGDGDNTDLGKIKESCKPILTMPFETIYKRVYSMNYESWWYKMADWTFKKFNISIKKYTDKLDNITAEKTIQIYRLSDFINCVR